MTPTGRKKAMTGAKWQRWKNIMKCYPFEEKRLAKWAPPYIVQPKLDGVRCRAVPLETGVLLLSSEENPIFSVPHINEALYQAGIEQELDGELYNHEMNFDQLTSITSRTVNVHPAHKAIEFHIFDVVDDRPQFERQLFVTDLKFNSKYLVNVPFWICYTLDDIMRTYDKLIELGYEGIIVRHVGAPYERKRSLYVMKFKPKKQDEYEIVGVTEEHDIQGNPKGRLGALVCKSGDGNTFNVGTGFSDEDRTKLWDISGMLPGMTAKVSYQHLTSGKKVPRFPVFVDVM